VVSLQWLSSKPGSQPSPVAYHSSTEGIKYSWHVTWTQPDAPTNDDNGSSSFPTVPVVAFGAAGLVLIAIVAYCLCCKKKKEDSINFTTDDEERVMGYRQIGHPHGRK
jgi:hypothetical protein